MIVYGTRSTQLAKEAFSDNCPNCGTSHSVDLYVFQKYFHVFWIPFFPIRKSVVSQCANCKQVLKQNQMPSPLLLSYDDIKSRTKTPIWTFSGLALVVLLIVVVNINDRRKSDKMSQLILTPQSGDVFEIKTKQNQYTLYKVDNVMGDSVLLKVNNFETNKISGLAEIRSKGETAYSEDIYAIHKNDLKQMLEKGEIIDIDRK